MSIFSRIKTAAASTSGTNPFNRVKEIVRAIKFSASPRLYGRFSSGAGEGEEIRIGGGLSIVNGELVASATNTINSSTASDGTANLSVNNLEVLGTLTANHIHGNIAGSVYAHIRAGENLAKGDPVYVSGFHGSGSNLIPIVSRADASNPAKMPAIGIMDAAVTHNANGHMVISGAITELNTAGFAINDELYVASGGGLTATPPTNSQAVARVERANANNGAIIVKIGELATSAATPSTLVRRDDSGNVVFNVVAATRGFFQSSTVNAPANYGRSFTETAFENRSSFGLRGDSANVGVRGSAFEGASATLTYSYGGYFTARWGTGLRAGTVIGDYDAVFGTNNPSTSEIQETTDGARSFIARLRGAFGWFRGAFTARITAVDTITANRVYDLPDASGIVLLASSSIPSTPTSTGVVGQIAADSSFFYICTATNTWRRVALTTW
jgi:hypothetical protein